MTSVLKRVLAPVKIQVRLREPSIVFARGLDRANDMRSAGIANGRHRGATPNAELGAEGGASRLI